MSPSVMVLSFLCLRKRCFWQRLKLNPHRWKLAWSWCSSQSHWKHQQLLQLENYPHWQKWYYILCHLVREIGFIWFNRWALHQGFSSHWDHSAKIAPPFLIVWALVPKTQMCTELAIWVFQPSEQHISTWFSQITGITARREQNTPEVKNPGALIITKLDGGSNTASVLV